MEIKLNFVVHLNLHHDQTTLQIKLITKVKIKSHYAFSLNSLETRRNFALANWLV